MGKSIGTFPRKYRYSALPGINGFGQNDNPPWEIRLAERNERVDTLENSVLPRKRRQSTVLVKRADSFDENNRLFVFRRFEPLDEKVRTFGAKGSNLARNSIDTRLGVYTNNSPDLIV